MELFRKIKALCPLTSPERKIQKWKWSIIIRDSQVNKNERKSNQK